MFAVPAVFGNPEAAIRTEVPRVPSSLSRGVVGLFVYGDLGGGKLFFLGQLAIDELAGLFWIEESASRERELCLPTILLSWLLQREAGGIWLRRKLQPALYVCELALNTRAPCVWCVCGCVSVGVSVCVCVCLWVRVCVFYVCVCVCKR